MGDARNRRGRSRGRRRRDPDPQESANGLSRSTHPVATRNPSPATARRTRTGRSRRPPGGAGLPTAHCRRLLECRVGGRLARRADATAARPGDVPGRHHRAVVGRVGDDRPGQRELTIAYEPSKPTHTPFRASREQTKTKTLGLRPLDAGGSQRQRRLPREEFVDQHDGAEQETREQRRREKDDDAERHARPEHGHLGQEFVRQPYHQ